ncbi:MAG: hypothetical protein E4G90_08105 [Gemmatimonadales bacterium]|nr:MAG: hypothetical protein E4G90_08105 [Gemmatimonadales bacterium]
MLEQVLELDDKEFEILVGHLFTALGFEGSEVTGKTVDGGVDATGELNIGVEVMGAVLRKRLDAPGLQDDRVRGQEPDRGGTVSSGQRGLVPSNGGRDGSGVASLGYRLPR